MGIVMFFSLLLGFYASILILLNLPLVFGAGILILMIFRASSSLGGNFVVFWGCSSCQPFDSERECWRIKYLCTVSLVWLYGVM